jgi:hypothetical protein
VFDDIALFCTVIKINHANDKDSRKDATGDTNHIVYRKNKFTPIFINKYIISIYTFGIKNEQKIMVGVITGCIVLRLSKIVLRGIFRADFSVRIADVAHTLNGDIKGIYEICHTHKTCSENRPEPWVEIDANSLLTLVNTNNEQLIINCVRCEKCENCLIDDGEKAIKKNKYKFITEQVSIFTPNFPDTTKMIACETDKNDISICSDIIVDCENNFNSIEKEVIDKFNINNIEDLIRNEKISKNDKQRCLKCFAYVRERYELMGIEPFNGHNVIQLEKYAISIRILPNGIIKYIEPN